VQVFTCKAILKSTGAEMKHREIKTLQIKGQNEEKFAEICRNSWDSR
jgi:hypothetical protein